MHPGRGLLQEACQRWLYPVSARRPPSKRAADCCTPCTSSRKDGYAASRRSYASSADQTTKAKQYASTLLLPKTSFPLRAPSASKQAELRDRAGTPLYRWQDQQTDRPLFVLHDGPPYANGPLHIGHALNKILKDIVLRYKVLTGYRVNYVTGWDCHGLPLELAAHKAIGPPESNEDRQTFALRVRAQARKAAHEGVALQRSQFQQFGLMVDWNDRYLTLDHDYEIRQLEIFRDMFAKGMIYQAFKPVPYSPSSQTALAEAEIEYKDDHRSTAVYARFHIDTASPALQRVLDQLPVDQSARAAVLVWTTTPWTLPANLAVAVNPDMLYVLAHDRVANETYVVAQSRLVALSEALKSDLQAIPQCMLKGSDLIGTTYRHHLMPPSASSYPIIPASHVTADSGTGLVHTAPAHGVEDDLAYSAYHATGNGQEVNLVDGFGRYSEALRSRIGADWAERLVGKPVLTTGNDMVIQLLQSDGTIVSASTHVHRYPYDWRTKKPIITRATRQWFIDLEPLQQSAFDSLERVHFVPPGGRARLQRYVAGRKGWCISRQRPWGVPILALEAADGTTMMTTETIDHAINVLREKGTDHWWHGPVEDFLPPVMQNQGFIQGRDTVDVWLDSGVTWSFLESLALRSRSEPVSDLVLEGGDQHRGWFQSSLLTSIATRQQAPYGCVVTHGFVLDETGRKMSKSLGNVISPNDVINGGRSAKGPVWQPFGVDVLRLWIASVDFREDMQIGQNIIQLIAENYRRLRNSARFMLGNLGSHPPIAFDDVQLDLLDRYVLNELVEVDESIRLAYDDFAFNRAISTLTQFTTKTLSSFYFDIVKDSLYCDGLSDHRRLATVYVLQQVLRSYCAWLAPILPLLVEEIASCTESESMFQTGWPSLSSQCQDGEAKATLGKLMPLRDAILYQLELARQAKYVGSSVEASVQLDIPQDHSDRDFLLAHLRDLERLCIVSALSDMKPVHAPAWIMSSVHLGVGIHVQSAPLTKCPRCWLFARQEQEELCSRCTDVLQR
ncbi:hypothetical protein E5Q_06395 [Mixia osmundae IAM 14324]|uniref:isoleucine--tRNA ligase n=1 Tax=Mixia osmundae (strain CBS 9802 / IAM 14324 / JCM 22182 / KY 12970) TaxID=764103 RepID=G7EA32_MIXOS|nr:hypothetical protein E5Q_06395 [Mixia osmundae IAM 14324]